MALCRTCIRWIDAIIVIAKRDNYQNQKKDFWVLKVEKKTNKITLPPQNMVNAVRRLPQIPQVGAVSTQVGPSQ